MAEPTVVRVSINDLMANIKGRIMSVTGMVSSHVLIVAKKVETFTGLREVQIRPGGYLIDHNWSDGVGRIMTYFARELFVTVRTRVNRDPANSSEQALKDSFGLFNLEEQVADALMDWKPIDANGNVMVLAPIKLMAASRPEDADEKKAPDWAESTLRFVVSYAQAFTQSYQ